MNSATALTLLAATVRQLHGGRTDGRLHDYFSFRTNDPRYVTQTGLGRFTPQPDV
jgi:hypothetical protein